jgi:hypothetical protein
MTQVLSLSANDYLNHQLFMASKSKIVKRRIYGSWIIIVALPLGASILLYREHQADSYYCLAAAIIWAVIHPFYSKWRYKKHYQNFIEQNYKNSIGMNFSIEFHDGYLSMSDDTGESKTKITELDEINEISDYVFIKMKINQSIIIPKRQLRGFFMDELANVANRTGIKIKQDLQWKWR